MYVCIVLAAVINGQQNQYEYNNHANCYFDFIRARSKKQLFDVLMVFIY